MRFETLDGVIMKRCYMIDGYSLRNFTSGMLLRLTVSCDRRMEMSYPTFVVRAEDLPARVRTLDDALGHYLRTRSPPCLSVVQKRTSHSLEAPWKTIQDQCIEDIDILWGNACETRDPQTV